MPFLRAVQRGEVPFLQWLIDTYKVDPLFQHPKVMRVAFAQWFACGIAG